LTIQATVCYIVRDDKVLLLKKANGLFGQAKWNAQGGKILPDEDAEHCAVREVLEETQLTVKNLEHVATVHFYKYDKAESPDWTVKVFLSRSFEGTPTDGREGVLQWFNVDALPFNEMWEDDQHWVRLALGGRRLEGWFYYSGDFEKLVDYRLEDKPLASVLI
jgi:8-oxo-dGTP diphosphatase